MALFSRVVLPAYSALRRFFVGVIRSGTDCFQSFSLFLPTIIKALGYTVTTAQLLTVSIEGFACRISNVQRPLGSPNAVAFILVLITSGFSDRLKARGPFMIWGRIVAIVGYVILLASKRPAVQYGQTFLVASGVYPGRP
jgi:hypothetical protein